MTSVPAESGGTVLPLLGGGENQRLLTGLIEDRYDIVSSDSESITDVDFDLCIVDEQSLVEYREELAEIETRAAVFLPYLLVTQRQDVEKLSLQLQDAVDEIVAVPTTKAVLAGRITNLLERRHSEERFRLLFQTAPDPVVVVSPDGTVSNANRAFVRMFGLDTDELGGVTFADLGFFQREEETDRDSHTLSWNREDGTTLLMQLHVNPITRNDTVLEWVGILRDITTNTRKREELEREAKRLNSLHWSRR